MLDDKLTFRTGVDTQYLQMVLGILNLDKDPEMLDMKKDFDKALAQVQKEG